MLGPRSCSTGSCRIAPGTSRFSTSASSASIAPCKAEEEYSITRTTIPTRLESLFFLPRNVGYHLEHHWYPSVPFYRLPDLHKDLMVREGFRTRAVVRRSVFASLGECIQPQPS